MGQGIAYCFRCQTRLKSADIDAGSATHVLGKVCCLDCLTPEELDLHGRTQEAIRNPGREKRASSISLRAAAGQQIVYCFRCRNRPRSADLGRGGAILLTDKICCTGCLTPEERELYVRLQEVKASNSRRREKRGSSTGTHAPGGGKRTRRSTSTTRIPQVQGEEPREPAPKRSSAGLLVGVVAGAAVLGVILLIFAFGGGSSQPPDSTEGVAPETAGGGKATPVSSDVRAGQLLAEARAFAKANPGDAAGFRERLEAVGRKFKGTPVAAEAERELAGLDQRIQEVRDEDLAALAAELKAPLSENKFGVAQTIVDRARTLHPEPEWMQSVGGLERNLAEKARARLKGLMTEANEAVGNKDFDRVRGIRDDIAGWGSGFQTHLADFDRAYGLVLASASTSEPEDPGGAPAPKTAEAASERWETANPYLGPWEKAMFLASRRDFIRAGAELLAAGESITDEKLRKENAGDLAENERLKNLYTEILAAMPELPESEALTLEVMKEDGGRIKVNGSVAKAGPHRLELAGTPRFVEYLDIPLGSLARIYAGMKKDELTGERRRTLAILCALDGDAESAKAVLGAPPDSLPRKYWDYASTVRERLPAPDAEAHKAEWAARRLFYEAEEAFPSPKTRGAAMAKYQQLRDIYADTRFVKRSRAEIAARLAAGVETLLPATLLDGNGIFKRGKVEAEFKRKEVPLAALVSRKEPDAQGLQHNVEFEFYAAPGREVRGWVLLGGCCKDTFQWFLQGTGLVHVDPRSRKRIVCDPSGQAAAPWNHKLRVPYASHAGRKHARVEKKPTRWEWAELPMPEYAAGGLKKLRLIGLSKGMAVAGVVVSPTRTQPPEIEEFLKIEEEVRSMTPRELTLDLGNGITMEFVYIPPGSFVMGGACTTEGRFEAIEVPKHPVTITKGFFMGKYEVTQEQYQQVMGSIPSKEFLGPRMPVNRTWYPQEVEFCGKVSELTGYKVRLPTEAEWEYACRAGTKTDVFWEETGGSVSDYAVTDRQVNPVGSKKPNPWGLYDMNGNVAERVADKYQGDYYANSPREDPTGPEGVGLGNGNSGTTIVRGGIPAGGRTRGGGYAMYPHWGFRVAASLKSGREAPR